MTHLSCWSRDECRGSGEFEVRREGAQPFGMSIVPMLMEILRRMRTKGGRIRRENPFGCRVAVYRFSAEPPCPGKAGWREQQLLSLCGAF